MFLTIIFMADFTVLYINYFLKITGKDFEYSFVISNFIVI